MIPSCPRCNKSRRVAHDRGASGTIVAGSWHCNACEYTFAGPTAWRHAGPGRPPARRTNPPPGREVLLRALRHLEVKAGRRYVIQDGPTHGAWADLALVVGKPATAGGLSDAWCGRRPCRDVIDAVTRWVQA